MDCNIILEILLGYRLYDFWSVTQNMLTMGYAEPDKETVKEYDHLFLFV